MERETRLMASVRGKYGNRPLREILQERYNAVGLPKMAEEMGVSRGALWYWILKEGLKIKRTAVLR